MEIRELVQKYKNDILETLGKLVSYNSVESTSTPDAPFGEGPKAVLKEALEICNSLGFETKNLDNYCGYAQMGEGEQLIGVLGHLDIVPAGEGWDTDPFTMTEVDGTLYGRGVSDDKGAVVAALYAMKIIKDLNVHLTKRVRLIMGCNEETGSKCLKYYVEKEGHVDMGFTPDGAFPGVHGEKGAIGGIFTSKNTKIIDINGGEASNVVCPHCITKVEKNTFSKRVLEDYFINNDIKYTIKDEENVTIIDVYGVAAHASTPEYGTNAISHTLVGLNKAGFQDSFVDFYCDHIGLETNGNMLGAKCEDEYGPLTLNNGVIRLNDGVITGTIDIRFPVTLSSKYVTGLMMEHLEDNGGKIEILRRTEPLFYPIDSPLVSKLLSAYQEVTGDYEIQPMTMGGGTYAKGINNCIAFGGEFPGDENHIHDANEKITIDALLKQTEIYVNAILKLCENE